MKSSESAVSCAARCRHFRFMFAAFVLTVAVCFGGGPAWCVELENPSSVIDTNETELPLILSPSPVQASDDSCLPLLKSARHLNSPSSAMDRNRRIAGKAAAIGLVFGVRFALGPKETSRSRRNDKAVRFDFWQARNESGGQAMAVADYRRCKNEQALKALSDWRWAR